MLSKNEIISKDFKKLVYGEKSIYLSNIEYGVLKQQLNNKKTLKFILNMFENNYVIKNVNELFNLSEFEIEELEKEITYFLESLNIEGFIFRKTFADSLELKDYSDFEKLSILAQYSLSYNWSYLFELMFEQDPNDLIKNCFLDLSKDFEEIKTNKKEIIISFDSLETSKKIVKSILESKIVLREQQIQIINNYDVEMLFSMYKESNITIKEIETLVLKKLINSEKMNKDFNLRDLIKNPTQVLNYVVNFHSKIYSSVYESIDEIGKINNPVLKGLVVKIPTSIRKELTKIIDDFNYSDVIKEQMFKNQSFWKTIFYALRYTKEDKIKHLYKTFFKIKDDIFKNDRSGTLNGIVEKHKKDGNYDLAIKELSKNKGYLFRNLLEYLRYTKDVEIAKKENKKNKISKIIKLKNELEYINELLKDYKLKDFSNSNIKRKEKIKYISKRKEKIKRVIDKCMQTQKNITHKNIERTRYVINDASDFFKSSEFKEIIESANNKLLWQVYSLLENEKYYKPRKSRMVQNQEIVYEKELPQLNEKLSNYVKNLIIKTIYKEKKKENKKLGKVYIDESLKNYNLEFSGRESNSITISGEYLSPGTKIDINKFDIKNKIIRFGVAWKGKVSCDIDHSILFLDKDFSVDFRQPTYKNEFGEVIISSSGDITECNDVIFSTELIDIDFEKLKNDKTIKRLITNITQFRGDKLNIGEIFWFMSIIDKKDRIIPGNKIKIKLDQMEYALQINKNTSTLLGFDINLEEDYIKILNIEYKGKMDTYYVEYERENIIKVLEEEQNYLNYFEILNKVVNNKQIVKTKEEADLILTMNKENEIEDKKYLYIGKDNHEYMKIIY